MPCSTNISPTQLPGFEIGRTASVPGIRVAWRSTIDKYTPKVHAELIYVTYCIFITMCSLATYQTIDIYSLTIENNTIQWKKWKTCYNVAYIQAQLISTDALWMIMYDLCILCASWWSDRPNKMPWPTPARTPSRWYPKAPGGWQNLNVNKFQQRNLKWLLKRLLLISPTCSLKKSSLCSKRVFTDMKKKGHGNQAEGPLPAIASQNILGWSLVETQLQQPLVKPIYWIAQLKPPGTPPFIFYHFLE